MQRAPRRSPPPRSYAALPLSLRPNAQCVHIGRHASPACATVPLLTPADPVRCSQLCTTVPSPSHVSFCSPPSLPSPSPPPPHLAASSSTRSILRRMPADLTAFCAAQGVGLEEERGNDGRSGQKLQYAVTMGDAGTRRDARHGVVDGGKSGSRGAEDRDVRALYELMVLCDGNGWKLRTYADKQYVVSIEIEREGGRGGKGLQGTSGDLAVKVALVFRRPLVP